MALSLMMESVHFGNGLSPIANGFAGTIHTVPWNMSQHGIIIFTVFTGVGTTGTSTITVEACDNTTPSNTSAIPFWSRSVAASLNTGDTEVAGVRRAAAGYTTTAGSHRIEVIEAHAEDMAASGYGYIRLTMVEVAASAVLGGILVQQFNRPARYSRQLNVSTLT